ncbi:MAG TPA: amidohydrolase family protein [Blastocatellia bacterium]|jgi:imidazolonepropionase-like amidohydrolase|nr:amidohydrolase family protein [Blastocatellia bacterium]
MASVNRLRQTRSSFARTIGFKTAFVALALSFVASIAMINAPAARTDAPDVYAIKDAQIVTGAGKVIPRGTVVFRKGLITEVGENVKIPADARVINGAGLTVYPGLIDAYTSLGLAAPATGQPGAGGGGGGRQAAIAAAATTGPPPPELALGDPSSSAADQVKPGGASIEDERSIGVTAALSSPRQGIFAGQSALINLAGDEPSRLVLRTPVALTIQFTTSPGFFGQYPNSLMGTVAFIRQSFYDAIHYRDEVERYNRVKRGVPRPEYDKKLAALQPAIRGEMPVLFITTTDLDIRRALMIADEFKLKPIIAGALYGYRVADLLKAKNVPVILSLDFPRPPADVADGEDEPLRVLRARAEIPKGAARLAQAGVKFAFTSGTLRPQDFIANVQKAVENGLSKDDALRALTSNAAEILGVSDQLGTIEVGKIANLVVTSGDLFARDTKVRHVFIDGNEIELKKPETPVARAGAPGMRPGGPAAAAVDPTGDWSLVVHTPQGDQNVRLMLRREGEQINGTLTGPTGTTEIRNARLAGNELRFTTSIQMGADTMEVTVVATIEGDNMRGTVTLPALGSFEFTGTRPR